MRIRRISIRNFRNLREIDIVPEANPLVLVGENNSGKSNLLFALRLLFDTRAERLALDLTEEDINYLARQQEASTGFSIEVELGDLQKHPEVEVCFKERLGKDGDETFVIIEGSYGPDDDDFLTWKRQVVPPPDRANDPIPLTRRMQQAIPLYFLDAVRDAIRDTRTTGQSPLAELLDGLDFSDVEDDVQDYLRKANQSFQSSHDVRELEKGLTDQLTHHVKESRSQVRVSIAEEDPAILARGIRLQVRNSTKGPQYDLSRYGTGMQNLVLFSIFRHKVASVNISVPLLGIEEPEAHLHPHAQRRAFDDFANINAPVVVATHSPLIVKQANPLGIVRLQPLNTYESVARQLNSQYVGVDMVTEFSKVVREERAELLFARSIIVVEGQTELITLPEFARCLSHELDREGVSVIRTGGDRCAFILRACHSTQLGIPTVVIFETDTLASSNGVVKEAYKAGYISQDIRDSCKDDTPDVAARRQAVLQNIGWFGAESCFEEEICRHGYFDVVLDTIDTQNLTTSLETFLNNCGLKKDPKGVTEYIKNKGSKLKLSVARAVATAIPQIGRVPPIYQQAIETAVALSDPELTCLLQNNNSLS